ncbi:MAG: putative quinol monooxygenase [Novosphingobium sp.]
MLHDPVSMPQTWYFQSERYVAAMIVITGSVQIRPEHRDAALALGVEHSRRSRAEPGCLAHNCHIDAEDPNRIVFLEEWAEMAAVKQHFAVPASGEFVRALTAMAVSAPEMKLLDAREIKR